MTSELATLRDREADGLRKALASAPKGRDTPAAITALRAYFKGTPCLRFEFEQAHGLIPNPPYRFAEALFRLSDSKGNDIKSPDVLKQIGACDQSAHLASRFRFWLAVSQMEAHFRSHPNNTHMSLNISADVAGSPDFARRMGKAMTALQDTYPGKGIILEMLEHQPWHALNKKAQKDALSSLSGLGLVFAVDDYGANDGQHGILSLKLAKKLSKHQVPLVKLDGNRIEQLLDTEVNMWTTARRQQTFHSHLLDIQRHSPNAMLVLEWVKNAGEVKRLRQIMDDRGFSEMPIHYVQGQHFTQAEADNVMGIAPLEI